MKYLTLICTVLFLSACHEDCPEPLTTIPPCIQDIIDDPESSADLLAIRKQIVNGVDHYWLETGARAYDGVESIVNGSCDTVCALGGFRPPLPCAQDYDFELWVTVWEE